MSKEETFYSSSKIHVLNVILANCYLCERSVNRRSHCFRRKERLNGLQKNVDVYCIIFRLLLSLWCWEQFMVSCCWFICCQVFCFSNVFSVFITILCCLCSPHPLLFFSVGKLRYFYFLVREVELYYVKSQYLWSLVFLYESRWLGNKSRNWSVQIQMDLLQCILLDVYCIGL